MKDKPYRDWLLAAAVLALFDFHSARPFDPWPFFINNPDKSALLQALVRFIGQWAAPLIFFLSGTYACEYKDRPDRFRTLAKRLIAPLVFGLLVLVPPQVYLSLAHRGAHAGPAAVFRAMACGLSGRGPELGHMRLLLYLLLFFAAATPLLRAAEAGLTPLMERFRAGLSDMPGGVLALALPLMLSEALLRPFYPSGSPGLLSDWANLSAYLVCFALGYATSGDERIEDSAGRLAGPVAVLALSAMACYLYLSMTGPPGKWGEYSASRALFDLLRGFNTWCWIVLAVGAGKRFFDFGDPLLDYARPALVPIYLLHQPVIVAVAYYVVRLDSHPVAEFIYIDLASFFVALFIYDVFVKKTGVARFIFGRGGAP